MRDEFMGKDGGLGDKSEGIKDSSHSSSEDDVVESGEFDKARLDKLGRSIEIAKAKLKKNVESEKGKDSSSDSSLAAKVGIELIAGVAVGMFLGFTLDKWLGTKPIFFLICFVLGVAGSFLNIFRMVKK